MFIVIVLNQGIEWVVISIHPILLGLPLRNTPGAQDNLAVLVNTSTI